ncbi:thyrotropin-releasing hormone receptor [Elysia marginata]|uniref:Thyrotropin-releasing hormone receptor n=1 Tax=Elysia marginata TaxID=1093978 RepID=A0AAV4J5M3_9GAST|nr:thyrotropin-releasing hormone receptor [Elysia marginata]
MALINSSLLPERVGHTTTFSFDNNNLINTTHVNCMTNCTSPQGNDDTIRYFCLPKNFPESCSAPSSNEIRLIEIFCTAVFVQNDIIVYIALALGMPGSIFALVTVSSLKYSPGMVYLGSLAVSDFLALVFASIILVFFKVADENESVLLKLKFIYAGRVFQAFSHWNLALICMERFITVRYPMCKSRFYSKRTVFLSLFIVLIISIVPTPFTFVSTFYYYGTYGPLETAQTFLYQAVYILVPGLIIYTLTFLTAIQLKSMAQYIRSMASSTTTPSSRSDAMETKMTKMMLLTSACFFVFACPFGFIQCFDRIKFWYLKFDLCHLNESIYIYLFYTLYAVSFLNHAVNFYIYCACAKGFRKQFVRVVFSKCCAKN